MQEQVKTVNSDFHGIETANNTHKNLTICQQDVTVRNRLVASLSTSCNNVVILSGCYKVVTHNLLTNCSIAGR
jgi:hypothetical protein